MARHSSRLIAATAAVVIVAAGAIAQRPSRGPATISVADVRPGMRGYGLTVFRGTEPERFDVEVIDVLHDFRPDQHLILVKTPHPILDRAIAVAGMSGSPIYLDGKLAGAYAYGWSFGTDPVIGVTPIENMLAEIDRAFRPDSFPGARPLGNQPNKRAALASPPSHARLATLPAYIGATSRGALDPLREHVARHPAVTPSGLTPAATPVMLAGFTDEVARMLGEELEPLGLVALQGGGGSRRSTGGPPPRFVDGGAIGVQLIRGDIAATAIGTVTHVGSGRRLVAFGHPMMNAGEIGLPTSTARVVHVLSSLARSFKIAEADRPLGTLVHDRPSAIVIDTGIEAATVPVRIHVHGIDGASREEWNVEVASHRMLTPVLVFGALANAVQTTSSDQADVMYRAEYQVAIEGHGTIELSDQGAMSAGPADMMALSRLRMFELMEAAYANPFETSRVERVDLDLHVRFARDALEIYDVSVTDDEVDPGSTVDFQVKLRRYGRPDVVRTVPVEIPERAAGTTVTVQIESGASVRPERPQPRDLGDILRIVEDRYPPTSFVVSLKMPTYGLSFRGHVVRDLPRSTLDSLRRVSGHGPGRPFTTYVRRPLDVGEVVEGSASIDLRVRQTPRESNHSR